MPDHLASKVALASSVASGAGKLVVRSLLITDVSGCHSAVAR